MSKTQQNTDGSTRGDLIDRLVGELEPVKPIRPARMFAMCLGGHALVAAVASWSFGIGPQTFARLSEPAFLFLVAVLALSASACTAVALRSSIPGRGVARPVAVLLLLVPVLLAAGVWATSPWGGTWTGTAHLLATGKVCMARITGAAVLPWLAMLLVLRWLAPLRELATGMFIGLSAFLVVALAVQLTCGVNDHYHLAFAHFGPVMLGTIVVGAVSAIVLRRSRQI